ncbi:hypothetical protein Ga0100231_023750 [Opitutaceae bacterium TAV4]|nr:hypothetical protein Ga0100231_023750 [Opitutaceae bacterium TAV4]
MNPTETSSTLPTTRKAGDGNNKAKRFGSAAVRSEIDDARAIAGFAKEAGLRPSFTFERKEGRGIILQKAEIYASRFAEDTSWDALTRATKAYRQASEHQPQRQTLDPSSQSPQGGTASDA